MQFKDFRPYQFGDEIRHMSWLVTARTGHPTLKTFEENSKDWLEALSKINALNPYIVIGVGPEFQSISANPVTDTQNYLQSLRETVRQDFLAGGDAAIVRVEDGPKALALTSDVTPRYCEANPFEGGSDHTAYLNNGKPGVLFWHFTDQFYHTDGDRIDMVSPFTLQNVGTAALVSGLTLASGSVNSMPGRIAIVVSPPVPDESCSRCS